MKTIQTQLTIDENGQVALPVLVDMSPGVYQAVLVLEKEPVPVQRPPLDFPVDDLGPWPEGLSLRREDMYDDDGR